MQVSFGVKQRRPKTVHEAVSSTLELESYLAAKPRSESISHVTVTDEPPAESIQAVQRDMIGAMQKLVERVEKLEMATKQRYPIGQGPRRGMDVPPRQSRGSQWNSGGQIVCRRCHQPGHYARGCAANMSPPGPRGQDTQGSWNQGTELNVPNVPNVHINNVSGCFVVGRVLEALVSFLVDTGAGVSLLRGDVWDRAMPENNEMRKEVTDRLVGVDGIPIKVRGTVSTKVYLEGLVFNQKFVIADGITVEAILGMDFLEANKCVLDLCRGELVAKDVGMIPLQPQSSSKSSCLKVTLVETNAIPAASEVEVKARVCTPSDKHIWMVEGKSARLPIRVARALVRPQNNLIPLRIVNTNLTPVTIYKGSTVAQAECMDEANIKVVSEKTEDEAIGPADWNPKVCSSLEGMLPKDINKDHEEKYWLC